MSKNRKFGIMMPKFFGSVGLLISIVTLLFWHMHHCPLTESPFHHPG